MYPVDELSLDYLSFPYSIWPLHISEEKGNLICFEYNNIRMRGMKVMCAPCHWVNAGIPGNEKGKLPYNPLDVSRKKGPEDAWGYDSF